MKKTLLLGAMLFALLGIAGSSSHAIAKPKIRPACGPCEDHEQVCLVNGRQIVVFCGRPDGNKKALKLIQGALEITGYK